MSDENLVYAVVALVRVDPCAAFGPLMFDKPESFPTLIGVMAAQMNDPLVFGPVCHVWTKSKRVGVKIPVGIGQYEENIG